MTPDHLYSPHECQENDVLSFGDATYKVGKFQQAVEAAFSGPLASQFSSQLNSRGIQIDPKHIAPSGRSEEHVRWFKEGVDCEILQLGSQSWKKAKLKIKFACELRIEDEPQPPLETAPPSIEELPSIPNQEAALPSIQELPSIPNQDAAPSASDKSSGTVLEELDRILKEDVW